MVNRNTRNRATLGGNLGADKSCSSLIPILIVLGAEVEIVSPYAPSPRRMGLEAWLRSRAEESDPERGSDLVLRSSFLSRKAAAPPTGAGTGLPATFGAGRGGLLPRRRRSPALPQGGARRTRAEGAVASAISRLSSRVCRSRAGARSRLWPRRGSSPSATSGRAQPSSDSAAPSSSPTRFWRRAL